MSRAWAEEEGTGRELLAQGTPRLGNKGQGGGEEPQVHVSLLAVMDELRAEEPCDLSAHGDDDSESGSRGGRVK